MSDISSARRRGRHLKSICLTAVSVMALGMGAQAAMAQDTPAAATDDNVVVVTGVRASIQKSLNIKRRSVQVVDSVVAEDIGKLPDNNVVEALQRVTGIQVANRGGGEGSGIFIRGMPDITTTWNGRNIFTASGRQLELQDIPSNLISRIDVYKTRSADQFEAGLGGQIDVFTRRPFDFKGPELSLSARNVYLMPADKLNPSMSALVSNRWETSHGDVGALLNVSYNRTQYRDENITAGAMVPYMTANPPAGWAPYEKINGSDGRVPNLATADPNDLLQLWQPGSERGLPWAAGSTLDFNGTPVPYVLTRDAVIATDLLGDRERPAANLALQWRPNADAEYTFEYAYEGYRNTIKQRMLFTFVDWWGSLGANPGSTVELYPNSNVIKSRTVNFPFSFTSGENTTQSTDTHIFALNGKWNIGDKLRVTADLSHVSSEFNTQFIALRATHVFDKVTVDFNDNDGVPSLAYGNNADAANPAMWNADYFYDNANRNEGSGTALTVRGVYQADKGPLKTISFGFNYDTHDATEARWFQDGCMCGPALTTYDPDFVTYNSGFFDGIADFPHSWAVVNGDYLVENADAMRRLVQAREPWRGIKTSEALKFDTTFEITEKTGSAYVMADFENSLFGGTLFSQIGVRYVDVSTDMTFGANGAEAQVAKYLPSVTVRYDATDDIRLRFNYGETLRRPNFADLNPTRNLGDDLTNTGYGTGSSGNPNLRPTESKNVDFGFEWYFARDSLFNVTLFRREIEGLVVPLLNRITDTDPRYPNTDTFIVTSPVNASDGVLQGAEVAMTYFPKWLPDALDGFGIQGSLTMLDSSQNIPITNLQGVIVDQAETDFFGVSDLSYNVTLVYDKGPFDARVSYVWRDDWLRNNEARLFANPIGIWSRDEGFLDFQLSYDVSDKVAVTFDATNILKQKSQGYYKFEDVGSPEMSNFNNFLISSSFAVGVRWKM
ncbi:tonB-dependent receptor family protein [Asticcacaulis biprosthecium C19]|uniref:TonB-dependent receptor family protein n=1 Tax=Asticcacaulis biprosthecium C19 TaxID=715226 RepID=F4QI20_9CAUL|nr:TonB-dependent receptor [Asticcacaulis biprosthecium]EGF92887.1 tonB-dependent receptor family protein [Asticcacaulis biprosthecium C19]